MKVKLLKIISLFLFWGILSTSSVDAQVTPDTTDLWQVETNDGNVYIGKVVERNEEIIRLDTESLGLINIKVSNLKSIKSLADQGTFKNGEFWEDNPQANRYFWAPNGYNLKKGEGYYQNVLIFFNQFSYGITDNVTLGAGIVPLFIFNGTSSPIWITPKFSIPIEKDRFQIGVGGLFGTVLGNDNGGGFGTTYGVASVGSRDRNLTLGLGYGFVDGEWANTPTITLSGMIRTGKRSYFITENYILDAGGDSNLMLISLGGRTVWSKISLDYGAFIPVASGFDGLFAIPWLGIVLPF